jgi:L-ascorbate metabolism protein UlaG (beta-lactamase superfamily)
MLKIRWLGHSTWWIETEGHRILVDPFLTDNPLAACKASEVQADTILVSHGHFDHVQDVAEIANRCQATVVANYEIATWFADRHSVKQTQPMNLGGSIRMPFGNVKMTIAEHSSQLPDGTYGGNPGGFLCEFPKARLFYTGDTALFSDLKLYAEPRIDVLILPIGDRFTMGIEDAVRAIEWIQPKVVLPTHYNTWPPIAQNAEDWANLVQQRTQAKPIILQPGEIYQYNIL